MTSNVCPICGHTAAGRDDAIQHALTHPARLPASLTIRERLVFMPYLVSEILATVEHPYTPDSGGGRGGHGDSIPRPAWVSWLLEWSPTAQSAPLSRLTTCSRIIWEALDPDTRQRYPLPEDDPPQWGSETAWLLSVWSDAQAFLDPLDVEWIDDETTDIVRLLADAARLPSEPEYVCPNCGGKLINIRQHLLCDMCGNTYPGAARILVLWRDKPPTTLADIAKQLRIPVNTLYTWKHRRKIKPATDDGLYSPWEVLTTWQPDLLDKAA